ncbi:hypothetical protein [Amycolatopsis cihanbeyliensis]|uniref:hypothetical protein n=1 Tax=Amycolatopsis cihanbeyliensis TaxID=1128664 RepID=UPI001150A5F3|nr:hypothetical protein [Amycolatopsis cihanbeyliensis]
MQFTALGDGTLRTRITRLPNKKCRVLAVECFLVPQFGRDSLNFSGGTRPFFGVGLFAGGEDGSLRMVLEDVLRVREDAFRTWGRYMRRISRAAMTKMP